jgi:hypothetical protein
MAQLYSFKIQGQTSGGAAIATLVVSYDSDGFLRFTDANGDKKWVEVENGCGGDVASLLKEIFTGAGGFDAGSAGVQGHRPFGMPGIIQ